MANSVVASESVWLRKLAGVGLLSAALLSVCGCRFVNRTKHSQGGIDLKGIALNMKHIASGPVQYVALGDSTGVGVGAKDGGYVARLFKRIEVVRPSSSLTNLCVSGATSEDVVRTQLERGIAAKPTLVTLGVGINDVTHGLTLDEFTANYDKILGQLTTMTSASILVLNIPDISSAPRIPPSLRDQLGRQIILFNTRIAELARKHGLALFDIYSSTHESLGSHPEFFSGDGFHPSDPGYEHWANEMWPVIEDALNQ
ncbi:MAG: SGNH/GDSL hydrolase family protein [Acidobacteriota bacterium]